MSKLSDTDYGSVYNKLSAADQSDWLSIAEGTFDALRNGGTAESTAAEFAILKANSAFSFGPVTVPENALMFIENKVSVQFAKNEDNEETPQLEMVGYSGGVIKDHWWWDDLAIDLEGVQFSAGKFPILENHDTDRKIAFTSKLVVDERGISADPATTVFLDNENSKEFVSNSKLGFPYQSSVYVQPSSIERVEKDSSVEVNGFTLDGPATVFRKCEFKEMSVCVFGWDSNTNATAFNKGIVLSKGCDVSNKFSEQVLDGNQSSHNDNTQMEDVTMDVTKFKADHPEVYAQVFSLGADSVKEAAEKSIQDQKDAFDAKFSAVSEKMLQFEKAEIIRSERELQTDAATLVSAKLAKSDVPEHLHDKVRQLVSYTKFMEDGKLDTAKFSEAVDTEIASWITAGVSQSVMGSSFSSDDDVTTKDTKLAEAIDASVDTLLSMV